MSYLRIELMLEEEHTVDVINVPVTAPKIRLLDMSLYTRLTNSVALLLRRNKFVDEHPQIAGHCDNCVKVIWSDQRYTYDPYLDKFSCESCSGLVNTTATPNTAKPTKCPSCESKFFVTTRMWHDHTKMMRECQCTVCKAQWTEYYSLSNWELDFAGESE